MDDEMHWDVPARGRLTISLLEGDVDRLRKDLERLEKNFHFLRGLMKKHDETS